MSLFGNRIYLSADYYFNETTDILENLEIPESTGRTEVKANGGVVTNKGVELYANIKWVNNSNLVFSTSFNMAYNKNVIKKSYYNYASFQEAIKSNPGKGGVINIIGLETGSIYGWKFAGVNPKTGNPQYYLTEEGKRACGTIFDQWDSYSDSDRQFYETIIGTPEQGIPDVVDFMRNDDTKQKSLMMSSMQYLGRSNPRFVGGFNTYLRYKNLEFTTSWTFKTGHIVPNFNDYQNAPGSGTYSSDLAVSSTNREKRYLYYWQFPGDVTDIPRFNSSGNDYWATMCTSANYSKGDYLRLTNLSLSYRFPARIIRRWGGIQNLSLGFNIRNLLTFTKYRGLDVGTGGGFPGIPLAILFPGTEFVLCDSIGKKIKVVEEVIRTLELKNARAVKSRAEDIPGKFDYIVSRAVANLSDFLPYVKGKYSKGILYLKGGDISPEGALGKELTIALARNRIPAKTVTVTDVNLWFSEDFFQSKKLIFIPGT